MGQALDEREIIESLTPSFGNRYGNLTRRLGSARRYLTSRWDSLSSSRKVDIEVGALFLTAGIAAEIAVSALYGSFDYYKALGDFLSPKGMAVGSREAILYFAPYLTTVVGTYSSLKGILGRNQQR
jgi:hypothetical protein